MGSHEQSGSWCIAGHRKDRLASLEVVPTAGFWELKGCSERIVKLNLVPLAGVTKVRQEQRNLRVFNVHFR